MATEPIPISDKPEKPSLVRKLCEAGAAVGWIEKAGRNEFHRYNYATEASIVSKLRGELYKRNVFIFPHIIKNLRIPVEIETVKGIRKTAITELDIEWTFVDGDSGEKWTVMVPGIGEDNVDKGLYKAFTGSEKYLLMKSFLLPTGDDPEKDSKEELEDAKETGRKAAKDVAERKIAEFQSRAAGKSVVTSLFYTLPQKHNGNYAEWMNLREWCESHPDAAEQMRLLFTRFMSKQFARSGSVLVPTDKMNELTSILAGDMGLDVKLLGE